MKEERFPHTRKPLRGRRLRVAEGGNFGATEESPATGVRRAKQRDSRTEGRPALTSPRGLSAPPPRLAGLEAEAQASVGAQGEDWGWRREHSLEGVSAPLTEGVRGKVWTGQRGKRLFLPSLFPGARG